MEVLLEEESGLLMTTVGGDGVPQMCLCRVEIRGLISRSPATDSPGTGLVSLLAFLYASSPGELILALDFTHQLWGTPRISAPVCCLWSIPDFSCVQTFLFLLVVWTALSIQHVQFRIPQRLLFSIVLFLSIKVSWELWGELISTLLFPQSLNPFCQWSWGLSFKLRWHLCYGVNAFPTLIVLPFPNSRCDSPGTLSFLFLLTSSPSYFKVWNSGPFLEALSDPSRPHVFLKLLYFLFKKKMLLRACCVQSGSCQGCHDNEVPSFKEIMV